MIHPIFKINLKVCLRTLSSLGKKKNGMDMTIRETPQMRNPPHHIPIHRRSEESLCEKIEILLKLVYKDINSHSISLYHTRFDLYNLPK